MQNKKIVAVVSDLMFTVKIQEAAKRAGLECVFVKSADTAVQQANTQPAAIIIDLNAAGLDAIDLIGQLKGGVETKAIPLVGYISHVEVALKQAAQQKGCDVVIARSAFSQNLPVLLKRYAEAR